MSNTSFQDIYNVFLTKITDEIYASDDLFDDEIEDMLLPLLLSAIPWFEFPSVNIFDYDLNTNMFNVQLTAEEVNIIAHYMVIQWLGQQISNTEVTKMQYTGSDFKLSSQAAHLKELVKTQEGLIQQGKKLQRLYSRRSINEKGKVISTLGNIMSGD